MMISPSDRQRIVRDALIAGMLPWVRLQARRMVRRDRRLDFDDLVQAGSIALLDAAADFNGTGSFFLHARSPVRWRMTDQAKAMRRQPAHVDGVDGLCARQPTPPQLAQSMEIRAALAKRMNRAEAIVFSLYVVEQCTAREIGMLIGLSKSTVGRVLDRLLRRLAADPQLQRLNGPAAPKEGRRAGNGSPRTDAGSGCGAGVTPASSGSAAGTAAPQKQTARRRSPGTFSSLKNGGPSTYNICFRPKSVRSLRRRLARAGGVFSSLLHPALSA